MSKQDEIRARASAKAANRGKAAEQWFADGNKLTAQTQKDFNALMKTADTEFEGRNKR